MSEIDVGGIAVRLGFKDDKRGFDDWERNVVRAQQVKDINAHLGAEYDGRGFDTYYRKLDETKARVAKRDAFKAVLGAEYDGRAFAAMERDLAKADRDMQHARAQAAKPIVAQLSAKNNTRGFDQWGQRVDGSRRDAARAVEAHLRAKVDPAGFVAYEAALKASEDKARRREAFQLALGAKFDPKAFDAYERTVSSTGGKVRGLAGLFGVLTRSKGETDKLITKNVGTFGGLSGAVSGSGEAVGGLAGRFGGLSGALLPLAGVLAAAIPVFVALGGAAAALAGSFAAALAGAAAVGVGIGAALGPLAALAGAVAQRVGLISAAYTALGAQHDKSGRSATAGAASQAAAAQQIKSAEQGLADAQRTVVRAQDDLTAARFRARREVMDLKTALDQTNLSEQRANLNLEQAVRHLAEVQADPTSSSFDIRDAQLAVKEAGEALTEARTARNRAITDAKKGTDTVTRAEQQLADARRGAARAADQVTQAQTAAAAATAKQSTAADSAQAALGKLTSTERGLLTTVRKTVGELQKTFKPATDAIFGSVDKALKTVEPLIAPFAGRFKGIGLSIAGVITGAAKSLSGPAWGKALNAFIATSRRIVKPIADSIGSVLITLRNIAVAAQPYVVDLAHWFERALGGIAGKTKDAGKLGDVIKGLVDQTKAWAGFATSVGKLLFTIFNGGAADGKSLVRTLTDVVRGWTRFLDTKPGQDRLRKFFKDSIDATKAIGKAVIAVAPVIAGVTLKLVELIGWLGRHKTAVYAVIAALAGLALAYGGPITVIATITTALIFLYAKSKLFREIVGGAFHLAGKAITEGLGTPVAVIKTLGGAIVTAYEKSKTFQIVVNAVFQFVRKAVGEAVDGMLGDLTTLLAGLSSFLTFASKLPIVGGAFKAAAQGIDGARDAIDHMREALRRGSDPLGAFAKDAQDMRTRTYASISGLRADVQAQMKLIKSATVDGSEQAKQAMATNFQSAIAALQNSMHAGTISVKRALREIDTDTRKLLKLYGFSSPGAVIDALNSPDAQKPLPQTAPGLKPAAKKAQGGWIGAPGMVGHDSVAIDAPVGGIVLNRHQLPVAQLALAASGMTLGDLIGRASGGPTTPIVAAHGEFLAGPHGAGLLDHALGNIGIGGLGELFGAIRTPHYMAAGGAVVGASMYGGPRDPTTRKPEHGYRGDLLESNPLSYAELGNGKALGGLPYRHPLTIRYAGRSVVARKLDIGAGGGDINGHARAIDLYYHLADQLGFNGLGVVGINGASPPASAADATGGGRSSSPTAAAARAVLKRVTVPGSGAVGALAQRAVDLARAGGQHLLDAVRPGAGAGTPDSAGGPTGLGSFDGLPVASWIVPELAYARSHGWSGHITSGYRSPTQIITGPVVAPQGQSEHQGTQAPHGAVDFGGPLSPAALANKLAFIRATAAYKGRKLLSAVGFRDDGHMSGTGHNRGGTIQAMAAGGSIKKLKATTSRPKTSPTTLHIRAIDAPPTDTVADYNRITASIDADRNAYELADRVYNDDTAPLIDPDTGLVNVDTVNEKADKLQKLVDLRQAILDKLYQANAKVLEIIAAYREMIKRLRTSLKHAKGKNRDGVLGQIDQAKTAVGDWKSTLTGIGQDIGDATIDLGEITQERAAILGTQPDQSIIDSNAAAAASTGDTGATPAAPPSPADIAAAAIADVASFLTAQQQSLSAYADNFITPFQATQPGGVFSGSPDQLAALGGAKFLGAGSDGSLGGPAGRSITIHNTYNQLPDNAGTWASQMRFQVEASIG